LGRSLYDEALSLARVKNPDLAQVRTMLEDALSRGDARAAYALGTWYIHGREPAVRKNLKEGVRLLRVAAAAGVPDALYDLAVCYQKGAGVAKNELRALALYLKAGLRGEPGALKEVGRCFYHGYGVARNTKIARVFLDRAAELGSVDS
jgi:TPR repeat protein